MNEYLKNKLNQLKNYAKGECWYLVKQPTDFKKVCYLVSILEKYQTLSISEKFEDYVSNEIEKINNETSMDISQNYRALLVAAYFGLIKKTGAKGISYAECKITDVYYEIKKRCNGKFEDIEKYNDIIQQQIEKIYVSSTIDDEYKGSREQFKLYPVMFLYKILIEIGRTTGNYSISLSEYEYFVATTNSYKNFIDVLATIIQFRKDKDVEKTFNDELGAKFDNRMKQALKQLDTLSFEEKLVALRPEYIEKVAYKLYLFENFYKEKSEEEYIDFLTKNISLKDEEYKIKYGKNLFPRNRVIFGAPGTGKSHKLENDRDNYFSNKYRYERVTFHPNYSYAQFVGTYKPVQDEKNNNICYKYVPGPFLRTYTKALQNKDENYLLIIEEINRANVAAVFGDVFQLLDRDKNGESEYPINASEDMKKYLAEKGIESDTLSLPSNMYIWATMNSADQGVFPMDTAFKRRWNFEYIDIDAAEDKVKNYNIKIASDKIINWNIFRKDVNKKLIELGINEDKLLGPFFISESDLKNGENDACIELFYSKVIMYLFEDVLKMKRRDFFKLDNNYTFSNICNKIKQIGLGVFDIAFSDGVNVNEKDDKSDSLKGSIFDLC